jgi:hypothetical protein
MIEIAPLLAALDACCGRRLLQGLLPGGRRDLHFVPFRAGIEIRRIYGDGVAGAAPASPGTSIEASSMS